jgi:hypothetical protein
LKIEVTCVEEHEDGSATCSLSLDHEGVRFLLNLGVVTALKEAIDNHKELEPHETSSDEVSGC